MAAVFKESRVGSLSWCLFGFGMAYAICSVLAVSALKSGLKYVALGVSVLPEVL